MKNQARAAKATTIDEYLESVSIDKRGALQKLRKDILAAAPGAEECISYGMPGFRVDGRILVWLGAGANHCAFYPGGVVKEFARDLEKYETSKGTIRFDPEKPLPATLVRKIVKARIAQNSEKSNQAAAKKRKR